MEQVMFVQGMQLVHPEDLSDVVVPNSQKELERFLKQGYVIQQDDKPTTYTLPSAPVRSKTKGGITEWMQRRQAAEAAGMAGSPFRVPDNLNVGDAVTGVVAGVDERASRAKSSAVFSVIFTFAHEGKTYERQFLAPSDFLPVIGTEVPVTIVKVGENGKGFQAQV